MAEAAVVPCPHVGHVTLTSYGQATYIAHALTGERRLLEQGKWSLSFDEAGDGVLQHVSPHGTRQQLDVADILQKDLFEGPRDGQMEKLVQVAGEGSCWLDVAASRVSGKQLTLREGGDDLQLLVYRHEIPKRQCLVWLPVSRIVHRLFSPVGKGFIAKRIDRWASRLRETFRIDGAFRTSWHADTQRGRNTSASHFDKALRAEEEPSVSLLALPILLCSWATSAHGSALIGQGTGGCKA
eukprot:4862985-Amphidinium_carterae.1